MRWLAILHDQRFKNFDEVLEMMKRLFIPGYEQVRGDLEEAEAEGVLQVNTAPGYPHLGQIEEVLAGIARRSSAQ